MLQKSTRPYKEKTSWFKTNKQTSLEDWPKSTKWKSVPIKSNYQAWAENSQKKQGVQILLNEC